MIKMSNPFFVFPRLSWIAVLGLTAFAVANPSVALGQGFSFVGVTEGGAIMLPVGASTTNLAVTATPSGATGSSNVQFVLEHQGNILLSRTSPPPYSTTFSNLASGKYFLSATLLTSGSPFTGDVSFDVMPLRLSPPNDNWGQALTLTDLNSPTTGTNSYATSEPGEPAHAGLGTGKSIWWSWNAVSNGVFTATTAGSGFDTVLAVYTGTNLDTLTEVGASDDAGPNPFSQVTFFATNSTKYFFAVDSASAASFGKVQLRLVAGLAPVISITSPADGLVALVSSPSVATNAQAAATITDNAGVARVDYWFDGGTGASRSGLLSAPYQLTLTNLAEGHYVLTLTASNNAGLVSTATTGFSVISLAPVLVMESYAAASKRVELALTGFKGPTYALEGSTNLEVWCSVNTWTNFRGAEKLVDTNAIQFTRRFYRASSSP